jgi:hypothetical protein
MPPLAHLAGRNQYAPPIGADNIRRPGPLVKLWERTIPVALPGAGGENHPFAKTVLLFCGDGVAMRAAPIEDEY